MTDDRTHDEAVIRATMDVHGMDREQALEHLNGIPELSEDAALARFVVDLFTHYKFDFSEFELKFWRDNEALARSENPVWSIKQREWIEGRMHRYGHRMVSDRPRV